MAWTEIDWLDGETITELKLDQMQQNIAFVKASIVPSGGIILWSGVVGNIPAGWYLCDGNNSTPNLTNRFVVGAGDSYSPGDSGGANTHVHDLQAHVHATSPTSIAHTHSITHTHTYTGTTGTENNRAGTTGYDSGGNEVADHSHVHTYSGTTDNPNTGSSGAMSANESHDHGNTGVPSVDATNSASNIPLYYALCYIMKS